MKHSPPNFKIVEAILSMPLNHIRLKMSLNKTIINRKKLKIKELLCSTGKRIVSKEIRKK